MHGVRPVVALLLAFGLVAVVASGVGVLGGVPGAVLADETDGNSTTLSGESNLTDADVTFYGETVNDSAGVEVVGAGDVTGDGFDDVLVGAPGNDTAYLFYGPVEPGEIVLNEDEADAVFAGDDDRTGASIALGDVTGDGFDDIVLGAPDADEGASLSGAAYVFHGESEPAGAVDIADANATLTGVGGSDNAGADVAVIAEDETEADGAGTILVGAPGNETIAEEAGAVYLVDGAELDGELSLADADSALYGAGEGARAGAAVAHGGDVSGDGIDEIVVGAPYHNVTVDDEELGEAGAAYVVTTDLPSERLLDGESEGVTAIYGENEFDRIGWSVAGAGDFDGNNTNDVFVGSPWNDVANDDAGAVFVLFGDAALPDEMNVTETNVTITGVNPYDRAGWSVATIPSGNETDDANGTTGPDDLLVGAPHNDLGGESAGTTYLVGGTEDPEEEIDLADAEASLIGAGEDDRSGWSVASAGDASGEGTADVLIGAPGNDTTGEEAGAAYLVFGEAPVEDPIEETPTPDEEETPTPDDDETPTPDDDETPTPDDDETPTPDDDETLTPDEEDDVPVPTPGDDEDEE